MKKHWTRSGIMNAAGIALLISAAAVSVVVYLLRYDQLWLWYKVYQEKLLEAEQFIQSLGISWKFVLAMLIVFLVRTFIRSSRSRLSASLQVLFCRHIGR